MKPIRYFVALSFLIFCLSRQQSLAQAALAQVDLGPKITNDMLSRAMAVYGMNSRAAEPYSIIETGKRYRYDHLVHPDSAWVDDYNRVVHVFPAENELEVGLYSQELGSSEVDSMRSIRKAGAWYELREAYALRYDSTRSKEMYNQLIFNYPALLLADVLSHKEQFKWKTSGILQGLPVMTFGYTDVTGISWMISFDNKTAQIVQAESVKDHELLGDVTVSYRYTEYLKLRNVHFPSHVVLKENERTICDLQQSMIMNTGYQPASLPDSLPDAEAAKAVNHYITRDQIRIIPVAQNLYSIELPQTNNRLMLALFKDYSVLLEGAFNSRNGDMVMDTLRKMFPAQPVKYASYSHFHDQYIGFVRSQVYHDVTLLFPPGNLSWVRTIVNGKHTITMDSLSERNKAMKYELVPQKKIIKDSRNRLEIFQVGPNHTAEYLVFYFPKQKIAFTGDLVFVKDTEPVPAAGERTRKLYKRMQQLKWRVDTIYTSWPLQGYGVKNVMPYSDLQKACTAESH